MAATSSSTARYFDGWYADMAGSPAKDEIMRRHLGLPPHLLSTSSLPWDGIADVCDDLRLSPGHTLLDLACGRGGYGLEIASRTDAALVGVDFSAEALRQAQELARVSHQPAAYRLGDIVATGLDADSVNAVVCLDSIQFSDPPEAAYREIRRVLMGGGRVVLTGWEPLDRGDGRLPERLRQVDLAAGLGSAGFVDIDVRERTDWRSIERSMWAEAAALDPGDDPALRSFHDEGIRALDTFDLLRRVAAAATAP